MKLIPFTVRDYARRGILPAKKAGKGWRFYKPDLVAWVRGKEASEEGVDMLILTLKDDEYITIGDSIKIKVIKTRGADVQLGIDAPPEMEILRNKLLAGDKRKIPRPR